MTKSELDAVIAAIKKVRDGATDETAVDAEAIYPAWNGEKAYKVGDRVRDADKLYKRIQPWSAPEIYPPHEAPALWVEIAKPGEYREIKEAMLPTEAFALDEIGWYKSKDNLWKSKHDNNTYTPLTYPDWWEKYPLNA